MSIPFYALQWAPLDLWLSTHHRQWNASFVIKAHCMSLLAIMAKARYARQSPPMRGKSLRPIVVEVHCARQSPPTRGGSLRPIVVKVRCARQSPPTRGKSLRPIVVEVRCVTQVLWWGADPWGPSWLKSAARDKVLRQGAPGQIFEAHRGHSLLHETKSSNKGKIFEAHCGQSPLCATKSSNEGQDLEAHCGQILCENIHSWISPSVDLVFSQQDGIYGFKFPKRFFGDLFPRLLSFTLLLN